MTDISAIYFSPARPLTPMSCLLYIPPTRLSCSTRRATVSSQEPVAGFYACLLDVIIILNTSSCPDGGCCRMKCNVNDGCRPNEPLRISSRVGEKIVTEWRNTTQFLSRHLRLSQLNLQLVCDVDNLETANAVVEPLLVFPTPAQFELRIGRHPVPTLKKLAIKAVSQAINRPLRQSTTAFLFLRLPVELQIRILELTDLIASLGEIEWRPKEGYSIDKYCATCDEIEGPGDCFKHHACQLFACPYTGDLGCFCNPYHATFSAICRCWEPPTSLFLVSRAIREVAQTVSFRETDSLFIHWKETGSGPNQH